MSTSTWGQVPVGVAATQDRWVAVGRSRDQQSRAAGREAARQALVHTDAALMLVFCSPAHDLAELLAGVRDESGELPLIGSTTAGEIALEGPSDGGVVVMALGGPGFAVATAAATGISPRLRQAGAEVATCVDAVVAKPHRVLLLLTDGLAGDHQEILRGAYSVAGAAVPLVGGTAADDMRMSRTHQFHGADVLDNAVVAAALGSDAPMGIGVRHSWRPFGEPMLVTGSSGSWITSLDDEPALDVYLRRLEAPAECFRDQAAFTSFAMTHPLGLSRRSGERLRCVFRVDYENRAISCNAQVPSGAVTWFMECSPASVLESTDHVCAEAIRGLDANPPIGLLVFDCVGRRGVLGSEGTVAEVERMAEHASGAPLAGFFSYGEIARVRGGNGFHNQTLVALALA
ncbi:MAG: FIST N-terminal domain-containing protein [Candidatus Dormibacteria bacterium]